MSELMGDEMLFSLWPEQFLNKPSGLDWLLKDQQIVPVPIVLLDDGRVAFQSDDGQICLVDGLQGTGEGICQNLVPTLADPAAELPTLSDATIKSMLVHGSLDAELGLDEPEIPDLGGKELPENVPEPLPDTGPDSPMPGEDDLKALVSFRCQFCPFSSTDVPSLMNHSRTEHEQPENVNEQTSDSVEEMENSLSSVPDDQNILEDVVEQFVYLCSECKEGFSSLTQCRDHMIKDHNMVFDNIRRDDHTEVQVDDDEQEKEEDQEATTLNTPPPPTPSPPPAPTPKDFLAVKLTKPRPKPKEYDPEHEAKPHKCLEQFCVHRFRTISSLEQHQECHAPLVMNSPRGFCCPKCSMLFVKWGQCALHLWKEHKIDIDLYTCNICGEYKTTTRRKLESHAKIHSDERPYKCKMCGKGFKQPTQLINHTASVHNKDKVKGAKWYMPQKCEVCLKIYADSKCLKTHMQAVHSKLKPYKCQICGHMSARKAMLQAHVRQHTGEKPFACHLCSFKTGDHNSLRRHVMRHTGKKPYKCPHCEYSSIQSSSFKSHLQSRHPGQGGFYNCKQCYFATVSEESFKKHLSDHNLNLIPPAPSEVEVFPENVAAAHLVYRSFGASPARLHCDVTASSTSRDGMKQTITISIPQTDSAVTDDEDTTHCFLPGDELDTGGITIPAEPENDQPLICFSR